MSLARQLVRPAARSVARAAVAAPASTSARIAHSRYYSSNSDGGRSQGNARSSPQPYALGLLGLGGAGGIAAWFSGDKQKDPATTQDGMSKKGGVVDYQKVYNAIAELLDTEDYDDGSYGPTLVRLAWHCSGTYDKNSGNGATMRFAPEADHGANAGLKLVRDLLEPVKEKFPGLSYSDLWTLAGVCAVQEMAGPKIPWRSGRQDGLVEHCTPDGRLPDGDKGSDHLRYIFYKMGFGDKEIVALSGAHALGRCHPDRSGFSGPWTFSPTTMTNDYYKLLLEEAWVPKKWDGPKQMEDKKTKSLMMLYTDMALTTDKAFRPITEQYAKDQEVFFKDFSQAFGKLLELGVPPQNFSGQIMLLKTLEEQQAEASKSKS
ncbi:MAG: heme peroxidase [Cyphobasidiales sp. Tagirdzhanova-0007]|nr:MAG: heme peroxidase [Cyphobasidiales sp. Tagirdzhanova-0007]